MTKVIQIRDVPDATHQALAAAAADRGMSLTGYLRQEMESLARRAATVEHNTAVLRRAQRATRSRVERQDILDALDDGRR